MFHFLSTTKITWYWSINTRLPVCVYNDDKMRILPSKHWVLFLILSHAIGYRQFLPWKSSQSCELKRKFQCDIKCFYFRIDWIISIWNIDVLHLCNYNCKIWCFYYYTLHLFSSSWMCIEEYLCSFKQISLESLECDKNHSLSKLYLFLGLQSACA